MSGNCCDVSDILDCATQAADCIRSCVGSQFNRYSTSIVVVEWSGQTVGSGVASVKSVTAIEPEPSMEGDGFETVQLEVIPGGRTESGTVQLRISNSVSEEFLLPNVKKNQEFYWELTEKDTGRRRRVFPVSSCAKHHRMTSRLVTVMLQDSSRTNDGTMKEKIKMVVPVA